MTGRRALVFGARGEIGSAITDALAADGTEVVGTSRAPSAGDNGMIAVAPFDTAVGLQSLENAGRFDAVVWAQGANLNDSLLDFDLALHVEVLQANCIFVAATLAELLRCNALRDGARLCIVSSIWQQIAREHKFSYTVSKAAISGLVHSASADLATKGILVNAVLPSVTDTSMTRAMLTREQIDRFARATPFERLTSLDDVAGAVVFLCSDRNTGVTGQSIAVDLGYTTVRRV